MKRTKTEPPTENLSEENVDQFADAAIDVYFKKNMLADGMLWARIVGIYRAKLGVERARRWREETED